MNISNFNPNKYYKKEEFINSKDNPDIKKGSSASSEDNESGIPVNNSSQKKETKLPNDYFLTNFKLNRTIKYHLDDIQITNEPVVKEPPATETEFPSTNLDYSSVQNLDANVTDLADRSNSGKSEAKKGSAAEIDEGVYDNVFEEISKMIPQFKEYIKSQLEACGQTYNDSVVEKYLESYITKAVKLAISNVNTNLIGTSAPKTLKETIDCVMDFINVQLGFANPFSANKGKQAELLKDTADYFLTSSEKKLKEVLKIADGESHKATTDAKKVSEYLDTYSKYINNVLEQKYNINAWYRETIVSRTKTDVLKTMKPDANGYYSINEILELYREKCFAEAEKFNL